MSVIKIKKKTVNGIKFGDNQLGIIIIILNKIKLFMSEDRFWGRMSGDKYIYHFYFIFEVRKENIHLLTSIGSIQNLTADVWIDPDVAVHKSCGMPA
jgi:hypothetical protein